MGEGLRNDRVMHHCRRAKEGGRVDMSVPPTTEPPPPPTTEEPTTEAETWPSKPPTTTEKPLLAGEFCLSDKIRIAGNSKIVFCF